MTAEGCVIFKCNQTGTTLTLSRKLISNILLQTFQRQIYRFRSPEGSVLKLNLTWGVKKTEGKQIRHRFVLWGHTFTAIVEDMLETKRVQIYDPGCHRTRLKHTKVYNDLHGKIGTYPCPGRDGWCLGWYIYLKV